MSSNVPHILVASAKTSESDLLLCRLPNEDEVLEYSFLKRCGVHILAPQIFTKLPGSIFKYIGSSRDSIKTPLENDRLRY